MAAFACVLGLAAGLACDPDQATSPLRQVGARANLANPDSVSAANLCGPRMSIRNANDDSIAVLFYANTYQPAQALVLPRRRTGEPFSETFVFMTNPQYGASLSVGTRFISMVGGPACPARPVVPALVPTTTDSSTLVQGSAYMVTDLSVSRGEYSRRRLWVAFRGAASQAVRQAVLDVAGATVLGGRPFTNASTGQYYIEVQLPLDSGLTPILRIRALLRRNAAVRSVDLDSHYHLTGLGVAPADSAGFDTWRFGAFLTADKNWHLEAVNAPMAWGCTTGSVSDSVAMVDAGDVSNADILPNIDAMSSAPSAYGHAVRVASILAAQGNNGHGMTGVMWNAKLRYFDRNAKPSGLPWQYVGSSSDETTLANVYSAAINGFRVINVSIGYSWASLPGHTVPRDTMADSISFSTVDALRGFVKDVLLRIDTALAASGRPWPLIVISAGNDGTQALWSGFPAVKDLLDTTNAQEAKIYRHILVVGGTAKTSTMSTLFGTQYSGKASNYGPLVDVVAPGEGLYTIDSTGGLSSTTGTSLSAPIVSGIAGLVLSARPTLDPSTVKNFILAGAGRGLFAQGATGPDGRVYKIVDAYRSLRMATDSVKGSLCGNRLWADGTTVKAIRGASIDSLFSSDAPIDSLTTFHGGQRIDVFRLGARQQWWLHGATWSTAQGAVRGLGLDRTPTGNSRSGRGWQGFSHDGNSIVTVIASPDTLNPELSVQVTGWAPQYYLVGAVAQPAGGNVAIARTLQNPYYLVAPSQSKLANQVLRVPGPVRNDSCLQDCSSYVYTYVRAPQVTLARPVVAFSPTGRYAYVAINRQLTTITQLDTGWTAVSGTEDRKGATMRQVPAGVTLARIDLSSSPMTMDTVWTGDPTANIHTLSVSEDGREVSFALSRDTVTWTNTPANGFPLDWQSVVASTATGTDCYQMFGQLPTPPEPRTSLLNVGSYKLTSACAAARRPATGFGALVVHVAPPHPTPQPAQPRR